MAYADDWGGADPRAHGRARRLFLMSSLVGMTPVIRRLIPDLGCRRMAFIPTASYAADYGVANRLMHSSMESANNFYFLELVTSKVF